MRCGDDIDYQASTNTLKAYWEVPSDMDYYTPDTHFAIEEMSLSGSKHVILCLRICT